MKRIFILIFCLSCLSIQFVFSQNLIWTSPSYTNGSVYSGWFILKNNPLEFKFYTYDYSSRDLKIMDGPLSSTPILDITLNNYESFSNEISYDYSGDGLNDLIISISNLPQMPVMVSGMLIFQPARLCLPLMMLLILMKMK